MPHNTAKEIGQDENCNRVAPVFSIAAGAPRSGEKATSSGNFGETHCCFWNGANPRQVFIHPLAIGSGAIGQPI